MASIFAMLAFVALAGCSFQDEENVWEISGPVFGTRYHINLVMTDDQPRLRELSKGIEQELEKVDAAMSTWRDDSELSLFNARADQSQWQEISPGFHAVLSRSLEIAELTDGAFDVTVGPVVNLWGFGPEARPETVPSDQELSKVLSAIGYEHLELQSSPHAVKSEVRQYVDLSAIAKGYAVDAVAEFLERQGVAAYLVEIGGEVSVKGRKPNGDLWRLAIEEPVSEQRQINRVIALDDRAMATSGDYRNYYESEGQRFSHTIDPKDGRPIEHNLASVTVIAEDCMTADALATAFNVMGPEKAKELATRENIAAYFIVRGTTGFQSDHTPAFSSYMTQ